MQMPAKLSLTALTVALLLSAAVTAASAGRLSISNQNIRVTWRSLEFGSSVVTIRCPVTLEGSFHSRTITKVHGTLIGAVTRMAIKNESCTNGVVEASLLPWHLTYENFIGALPRISDVDILLSRFRFGLTIPGLCTRGQYGTTTDNVTGGFMLSSGIVTGFGWLTGGNTATLVTARDFCPPSVTLRNLGIVTLLNSQAAIVITLI